MAIKYRGYFKSNSCQLSTKIILEAKDFPQLEHSSQNPACSRLPPISRKLNARPSLKTYTYTPNVRGSFSFLFFFSVGKCERLIYTRPEEAQRNSRAYGRYGSLQNAPKILEKSEMDLNIFVVLLMLLF